MSTLISQHNTADVKLPDPSSVMYTDCNSVPPSLQFAHRDRKILVVDDSRITLRNLKFALSIFYPDSSGNIIHAESDSRNALQRFNDAKAAGVPYDTVVTDLYLAPPGVEEHSAFHGDDLLREIFAEGGRPSVVVHSGSWASFREKKLYNALAKVDREYRLVTAMEFVQQGNNGSPIEFVGKSGDPSSMRNLVMAIDAAWLTAKEPYALERAASFLQTYKPERIETYSDYHRAAGWSRGLVMDLLVGYGQFFMELHSKHPKVFEENENLLDNAKRFIGRVDQFTFEQILDTDQGRVAFHGLGTLLLQLPELNQIVFERLKAAASFVDDVNYLNLLSEWRDHLDSVSRHIDTYRRIIIYDRFDPINDDFKFLTRLLGVKFHQNEDRFSVDEDSLARIKLYSNRSLLYGVLQQPAINGLDFVKNLPNGKVVFSCSELVADDLPEGPQTFFKTLGLGDDAGVVRISISDNGPGIPSEIKERVFEPNFTTRDHGSGFGLSFVKEKLPLLKGCVVLDSEVGKGTTFHFYFPAENTKGVVKSNTQYIFIN